MKRPVVQLILIVTVVWLFSDLALAQGGKKPDWVAPFFYARRKNPVPADAQSIALGKDVYVHNCLSCHGEFGKGDGPKATDLDTAPGDLTSDAVKKESDGALYWKTTVGRKPMPSHEKLLTDTQRWQVVNYMRTLTSSAAAPLKARPPTYDVPVAYRSAISTVLDPYLSLGEALAKDDLRGAKPSQAKIASAAGHLAEVKTNDLPENVRAIWKTTTLGLTSTAKAVGEANNIASLRTAYKTLSTAMIDAVGKFGFDSAAPLYQIECPKAFDNAGASWLQATSEAHNPYLAPDAKPCRNVQGLYAPKRTS